MKHIIDSTRYPLESVGFHNRCKQALDINGVVALPGFLLPDTITTLQEEGKRHQHLAYFTANTHNVYLSPSDADFPPTHPRNRAVNSSKGCITTDQIPPQSPLRKLYDAEEFRAFLRAVLGESALHEYADTLSSINLHYASAGQELGWHFDNSSFAITLLVQKPQGGGAFEYVRDVRDADRGDMNYNAVADILDGKTPTKKLSMDAGSLVLFRGRNAMHRVTPVMGDTTRMLAVLAYNTEPGISLSESARMTFFGRLA